MSIIFWILLFLHATGLLYGEHNDDPRGGMRYDFEDVAEMLSILPEDNLLHNYPMEQAEIYSCYGTCKFDTTDFLEYEQYFMMYIYAFDKDGHSMNMSCSIDDSKSSRTPMEWKNAAYEDDKVEIYEIEDVTVYYSAEYEQHQAMFYIGTDIYEFVWEGEDKEVFLEMLEDIIK